MLGQYGGQFGCPQHGTIKLGFSDAVGIAEKPRRFEAVVFDVNLMRRKVKNAQWLQAGFDVRKSARAIDQQPRLMTGIAALHGAALRIILADNGGYEHAVKGGFHQFSIHARRQFINGRHIATE